MATKTKKWILAIVAVILVVAIVVGVILLAGPSGASELRAQFTSDKVKTTGEKVSASEDYVKVAESDTYELHYYEPTFSIRLVNKKTGKVMDSTLTKEHEANDKSNASWKGYMGSGIVLTAIVGTNNTQQVDMITAKNEITTWYTEDGIYAEIFFKDKYQFGLGVEIRLLDDQLVVRVPESSIKEKGKNTYISTVSLFPFMGYTYLGEKDGYMLVPDGNGALIYLNDKEGRYSAGFSQMVYGTDAGLSTSTTSSKLWGKFDMVTDSNSVFAPIFGMAHTEDQLAYLGVVESGDERCSIEVQPNGVMVDYNRCFAKFLLRDVFVQPLNNSNSGTVKTVESDRLHTDLQVRYCLLSGEEANYSGMANAYRDYLLEKGLVKTQDTSYKTRVDFLGVEQEEFLMGTTDVTMTTIENIEDICIELRTAGVTSLLSVYKGWQNGGLYNFPISSYKADSSIGSTAELTRLIQRLGDGGHDLYLYNDGLLVNVDTNASTFNVMKMINRRTFKLDVDGQVYDMFYYLLPSKASSNLNKFVEDYTAEGINNLALAGLSDTLFSFSSKGSYYSRSDTKYAFETMVAAADERCDLILEAPNAYLWKHTAAFLDMPMGSTGYLYVDQNVPFMSMVLKGVLPMYSEYVNFEANKTENFLQMVESGIFPSFYVAQENSSKLIYTNSNNLYSLEFASYMDTIEEYDAAFRQLAEVTEDANILRHESLSQGFVKVTYSNGAVIYVNYTQEPCTADGITVEAQGYMVGGETA